MKITKENALENVVANARLLNPENFGRLVTLNKSYSFNDASVITLEISWGCCGSQNLETVKAFLQDMKNAIDRLPLAKKELEDVGFTVVI